MRLGPGDGALEGGGAFLDRLEVDDAPTDLLAVGEDTGHGLAVLPRQLVEQVPARPHLGQPLRVGLPRLDHLTELGGHVAGVCLDGGQPGGQGGQGCPPGQGALGGADQVERTAGPPRGRVTRSVPVGVEGGQGGGGGRPVGVGLGQSFLLGLQHLVLVGVVEAGAVDLRQLVAEQVDLARPGALVPAEGVELGGEPPQRRPGVGQGSQVDGAEEVEGPALHSRIEKRLMGVLTVQVHQPGAGVGQGRDRRHPPVDPGPRPSLGGHGAGQDHLLLVIGHEPSLDEGLVGAGADEDGVGAAPHQQLEGLHQQRLAGTGLPRERRHAGGQLERHLLDDAEVPHPQLDEHDRPPPPSQRSARWNRDRRMAWKSRSPSEIRRAFLAPSRHSTASPGSSWATLTPSTTRTPGRGPATSSRNH